MVYDPKTEIKSNFVKGLEEPNNRILTYVTIFFTFAFLGCLLAFWIYEHRGSRCVFGGSCCLTDLTNSAGAGHALGQAVMSQRGAGTSASWTGAASTNPEILTFTSSSNSQSSTSFSVELYNEIKPTGKGTSFPKSKPPASTGYVQRADGVSVYLYQYQAGWGNAYQLVSAAATAYVAGASGRARGVSAFFYPSNPVKGGTGNVSYLTNPVTTNDGPNTITTSFKPENSFFSNFNLNNSGTADGGGIMYVLSKSQDNVSYNPMSDFFHTKRVVRASGKNCTGKRPCGCTEPSSKNLPSCRGLYDANRQQYPIVTYDFKNNTLGGITGYSTNCSHAYNPYNTTRVNTNNFQEIVPQGSALGKKLSNADSTGGIPSPGVVKDGDVNFKLGKTPFKSGENAQNGIQITPQGGGKTKIEYGGAYVPQAVFCGNGDKTTPEVSRVLFTAPKGQKVSPTNKQIQTRIRNSKFPNAKNGEGDIRILGFN